MKLKNKLFPLIGIAAVSSVVAPIASLSSCGQKIKMNTFDLVNQTFQYSGGESSIKTSATMAEATKNYIQAIKTNPQVFVQDYVNQLNESIIKMSEEQKEYTTVKKLIVSVSDPVIGSTTVAYPGEPSYTYPTISFSLDVDTEIEYDGKYGETELEGFVITKKEHGRMTYENVPFFVTSNLYGNEEKLKLSTPRPSNDSNADETYWEINMFNVFTNFTYIFYYMTDPWKVDGNVNSSVTFKSEYGEKTRNDSKNIYWTRAKDIKASYAEEFKGYLATIKSKYLSKVGISAEMVVPYGLSLQVSTANTNLVTINGIRLSRPLTAISELTGRRQYTVTKGFTVNEYSCDLESYDGSKLEVQEGAVLELNNDWTTYTLRSGDAAAETGLVRIVPAEGQTLAKTYGQYAASYMLPSFLNLKDSDGKTFAFQLDSNNKGSEAQLYVNRNITLPTSTKGTAKTEDDVTTVMYAPFTINGTDKPTIRVNNIEDTTILNMNIAFTDAAGNVVIPTGVLPSKINGSSDAWTFALALTFNKDDLKAGTYTIVSTANTINFAEGYRYGYRTYPVTLTNFTFTIGE